MIFTIDVHLVSDDFWELYHPHEPIPALPFLPLQGGYRYDVLHCHLGLFYGKRRGSQWLTLDATMPEEIMITFLGDLLSTRILPYLDRLNSLDDILPELGVVSTARMEMLAWLGRRDEAYAEFTKLMAWRHQRRSRINLVKFAKRIGIIE